MKVTDYPGAAMAVDGTVDDSLAGATWVEVYERVGRPTAYRIRFEFDIGSTTSSSSSTPGSSRVRPVGPGA